MVCKLLTNNILILLSFSLLTNGNISLLDKQNIYNQIDIYKQNIVE
jgi:hypothetical protein